MPPRPEEWVRRGFGAGKFLYRSFVIVALRDVGRGLGVVDSLLDPVDSIIFDSCPKRGSDTDDCSYTRKYWPAQNFQAIAYNRLAD